jgi:dTDP-4-dehydrorhamnose reductase
MRLLVFGGWGQLGSELAAVAEGRHELLRPRRTDVDVTDPERVREAVDGARPDAVVNAAAFHQVEECEQDPGLAFAVNAVGARHVARAAATFGARSVFVSSDYVFAGDLAKGYEEDEVLGPVNAYGASKAAGEWLVRQANPDSLVVRGSALFGHAGSSGKGGNFVETILAKASAGQLLSVVDDVVISPTAARDMAERIVALLEHKGPPGTYHAANEGRCSWYEFAREIVEAAGLQAEVSPRPSHDDPVRRPSCSVLLDTKSPALGLAPARHWQDALAWYLSQRPQPAPTGERRG